jgi:Flp pilus assembly protein TadG
MTRVLKRDRGSVSAWVVVFTGMTLLLLGLVVDGGQAMIGKTRAADIAEQASRAAADALDTTALRNGDIVIDQTQGCAAATSLVSTYNQANGLSASLQNCYTSDDNQEVTVTVDVVMTPAIPWFVHSFTLTATESAFTVCGTATGKADC